MESQNLELESRTPAGKGAARQLRAQGKIPGVVYGLKGDAISVTLSPKALTKALTTSYNRNVLLKLQHDGNEQWAMVKDLDVHPITKRLIHADFIRVNADSQVHVQVPLKTKGRAIGSQRGGALRSAFRTLPVLTTPEKIPAVIELDVSNLDLHQAMTVADLSLDEGVKVKLADSTKVVFIGGEQRKKATEENKEEAAEGDAAKS